MNFLRYYALIIKYNGISHLTKRFFTFVLSHLNITISQKNFEKPMFFRQKTYVF